MATLREYFDTELSGYFSKHKPWGMKDTSTGKDGDPVIARISEDFDSNAKFWSFYVPYTDKLVGYVGTILSMQETRDCVFGPEGDNVSLATRFHDYSEEASSDDMVFTHRVFLYIDNDLSIGDREAITTLGKNYGFYVQVRDREYAIKRSVLEKPLAFISHDSSDKKELVRPLAQQLSKMMCPIWYDEYSLVVGSSLRESIERGLKETNKCVLVISPDFISNKGWGKAEFDSIFTKEILKKENLILPVWHNVTVEQVYEYSPRLADKVALNSDIGVEELARKLASEIR